MGVRGKVGRETEKQNQREKKKKTHHDTFHPPASPGPRPELMRVRMSTNTVGEQQ